MQVFLLCFLFCILFCVLFVLLFVCFLFHFVCFFACFLFIPALTISSFYLLCNTMAWELSSTFYLLMHLRPNQLFFCPSFSWKVPVEVLRYFYYSWFFLYRCSSRLSIFVRTLRFVLRCCFTSNVTVPYGCPIFIQNFLH